MAGVLTIFSFLTEALADLGSGAAAFLVEALPDFAAFSDLAGVALASALFSTALAGRFFPDNFSGLPSFSFFLPLFAATGFF